MANIKAFYGIRPKEDMVSKIAALPYDVYSSTEARKIVSENPDSFLKIDRPETQFSEDMDMYSECVYKKAEETLIEMLEKGKFIQDIEECFYLYQLEMGANVQTGIVGCASIDDYLNEVILKHENTREVKEQDRIRHVDICNAQTGPIFLAYRSNQRINTVTSKIKQKHPLYHFTSEDRIKHTVWMIHKEADILEIQQTFATISRIYIADGHHRAASAVKVGLKRRAKYPDYDGTEEFNFFLSVLFPDNQLNIIDYNRVVHDLNGYDSDHFLKKISEVFNVKEHGSIIYKPMKKGYFGMFLDGKWYELKKQNIISLSNVQSLDVSYLQNKVLDRILNIKDPTTDKRIHFVGGIRGLQALERDVSLRGTGVAFAMYPTSMEELFAVADSKQLMPPKSTWFEPKLRSGLFIHKF